MNIHDVHLTVSFPNIRLDTLDEPTHGYYVHSLNMEVRGQDDDDEHDDDHPLGQLECFLFDAVGSFNDDESSLFEQADADGASMEFYEFIFVNDLVRGRLLHRLDPSHESDDDDGAVSGNVLCVSAGWWACSPELLMRAIARAARVLDFRYVCVDSASIRLGEKDRLPPDAAAMALPGPFVKVIWREIDEADGLAHPDRWFYFGDAFGDDSDEGPGIDAVIEDDAEILRPGWERTPPHADAPCSHPIESQVAIHTTPIRWCHSCGALFDESLGKWVSPIPGHKVHDPQPEDLS